MKASKQLIEMLTQGGTDYAEIAQVIGVGKNTAGRICRGKGFLVETAWKISKAFPGCSADQLFQSPNNVFETWKRLRDQLDLTGKDELTPEAKQQIQSELLKLRNAELQKLMYQGKAKAHPRKHRRRNKIRKQLQRIEVSCQANKSTLLQTLQRVWIGFRKWLHHPGVGGIQANKTNTAV